MPTQVSMSSPAGQVITWKWQGDLEVGFHVDGQPYVKEPSAGAGVDFTEITPYGQVGSRQMNGSMLSPVADGVDGTQGFDSGVNGWNASKCINTSLPLNVSAGQTIVSSVTREVPSSEQQWVDYVAFLTVVAETPAADQFRPPYVAASLAEMQTVRRVSDLNLSLLPEVFVWDHYMGDPAAFGKAGDAHTVAGILDRIERAWIDFRRGWTHRYIAPELNQFGYGEFYCRELGKALIALVSDLPSATKEQIAIHVVQKGLDNFQALKNGMRWPPDGGHQHGRMLPILIAGHLLGEQEMLDIGTDYPTDIGGLAHFAELGQTFVVEETSPGVINFGDGGYLPSDVGLPEWGIQHHNGATNLDSRSWLDPSYRLCCSNVVWMAELFVAKALGLRENVNHQVLFDWFERYQAAHIAGQADNTGEALSQGDRASPANMRELYDDYWGLIEPSPQPPDPPSGQNPIICRR